MLNHNTLLLIQTQEELNQLAEATKSIALDSLHIDEHYVAFMEEVLIVIPQSQIEEGHWTSRVKPTLFSKWYKKQNRR